MKRAGLVAAFTLLVLGAEPSVATLPGSNGRIAFVEFSGAEWTYEHVFRIQPDGRDLAFHFGAAKEPAYSPDGRRLVVAGGGYSVEGRRGLFLLPANRRARPRRLTGPFNEPNLDFSPDTSPSFAPGGGRIVFERAEDDGEGGYESVLRIYRRGRSRPLTAGGDPSWSVRGLIAFERSGGIWVVRPDGSGLRRIIGKGSSPDWSPDGKRVVYDGGSGLIVANAGGTGRRVLVRRISRRNIFPESPCWSPDGRLIAFGDAWRLRIVPSEGGRPQTITELEEASVDSPAWQPLP